MKIDNLERLICKLKMLIQNVTNFTMKMIPHLTENNPRGKQYNTTSFISSPGAHGSWLVNAVMEVFMEYKLWKSGIFSFITQYITL